MPRSSIGARGYDRVEVEVLTVLEPVDDAVALGADALELAPDLGEELGMGRERLVEEIAGIARERNLAEPAPSAPVVADPVVPLVVEERAVATGRRRDGGVPGVRLA